MFWRLYLSILMNYCNGFGITVSIARRIIDPISEYVKIAPKHLGVGLYQVCGTTNFIFRGDKREVSLH